MGSLIFTLAQTSRRSGSTGDSDVATWDDLLDRYLVFREGSWPILVPPTYLRPDSVEDTVAKVDIAGFQEQPDWYATFDVGTLTYSPRSELAQYVKHGQQFVVYEDLSRQELLIVRRHDAEKGASEEVIAYKALPWPEMDRHETVSRYLVRELSQRRIVWLVTLADESQIDPPDAGEEPGGESLLRMISGGSCTEIVFTAVEQAESNEWVEMGLCVPDGIAQVDIFGTTNLSGFPWFPIATNLPVTTHSVVYAWTNVEELAVAYAAGDSNRDTDQDSLSDARETMLWGSNPALGDTDGDGVDDGAEVSTGTQPLDPNDPPNVKGTVSYYGEQTNVIRVLAVTDSNSWSLAHSATLAAPGDFQIANLPGSNYFVKAFRDLDHDGTLGAIEARGAYSGNPVEVHVQVTGVAITLTDPDSDGDGLTDYEEVTLIGTDPTNSIDGVEKLARARAVIAQHWG